MARDVLSAAWKEISRRHFAAGIKMLTSREEIYEDNAEYYIMMGTALLYSGDAGSAAGYYQRARRITVTNVTLLLGQAAIYLRRGLTDRALDYYLEVLDQEPGNKTAKRAMEFIRTNGEYETICKWADTGKLEEFYPPLGINSNKVLLWTATAIGFAFGVAIAVVLIMNRPKIDYNRAASEMQNLVLSKNDEKNALVNDLSHGSYNFILSAKEITDSYNEALKYFQMHRDNMCQVEINRILVSNASDSIKEKARLLQNFLEEPGFDTVTDVFSAAQIAKEPSLYTDCYVVWGGRVSNVFESENSYSCRFLVGYEDMKNVEAVVPLDFDFVPLIEPDLGLKVLGKIEKDGNGFKIKGLAVYQSPKNGL